MPEQKLNIFARFVLMVSVAVTSEVHVAAMLIVTRKLKITKMGLLLMAYQYYSYKVSRNPYRFFENVIRKDKTQTGYHKHIVL